jgi:hypothetical protein
MMIEIGNGGGGGGGGGGGREVMALVKDPVQSQTLVVLVSMPLSH